MFTFNSIIFHSASHAPPSILNVRTGQHVELRVAKRVNEDYEPPKGTRKFGGSGQRLGGVVPEVESHGSFSSMPGSFPSGVDTLKLKVPSSEDSKTSFSTKFEVDQSQPMTTIQIRLADGTRYVSDSHNSTCPNLYTTSVGWSLV